MGQHSVAAIQKQIGGIWGEVQERGWEEGVNRHNGHEEEGILAAQVEHPQSQSKTFTLRILLEKWAVGIVQGETPEENEDDIVDDVDSVRIDYAVPLHQLWNLEGLETERAAHNCLCEQSHQTFQKEFEEKRSQYQGKECQVVRFNPNLHWVISLWLEGQQGLWVSDQLHLQLFCYLWESHCLKGLLSKGDFPVEEN